MESKIQQLTEAIYNEGIQKAQQDADILLNSAREKAALIVEEAQTNASSILREASSKAEEMKRHVESEIKMTVSQAISALKQEITSLTTMKVIQPSVKETFSDQDFLKTLISSVVKGWMEKGNFDLDLILPEKEKTQLEKFFKNNLAAELNKGLALKFSDTLKSGFKIGPSDGSYYISFTEDDFVNFLKAYLRPKTNQLLFEGSK